LLGEIIEWYIFPSAKDLLNEVVAEMLAYSTELPAYFSRHYDDCGAGKIAVTRTTKQAEYIASYLDE
jgi:hypothetical protein